MGRTEDTETRPCSDMPAFWRASSNALRSNTLETALSDVMKNFVGTGNMALCGRGTTPLPA
jgi:hypothetical protein